MKHGAGRGARRGQTEGNGARTPRWMRVILIGVVLGYGLFGIQPVTAIDRDQVASALRSTVQVIMADNDFVTFSLGSGTVINEQGLILTNNHVVENAETGELMNDEGVVAIAVAPQDLRGESVLKYLGTVVKRDPELDLALVQITGLIDDPEAPLPENLGLTPANLGNSDDLMISDEVNMFGYPGIGSNTPTYTKGIVSGFLDENRDGVYEWIKTDAVLAHGNSGGLATDGAGKFVGVPTRGNSDEAGTIGLVRSGNVALGFVNSYFPGPVADGANVSNVRFAESVTRRGAPRNADVQFDSGLTELYATFDYDTFEDGKSFTYIWYVDGFEAFRESYAWDGGESGHNWVNIYHEDGLDDGYFEVELVFDGHSLYRGGVVVGEADAPPDPAAGEFGPISFAPEMNGNEPVDAGDSFQNIDEIFGVFDYSGMSNGVEWRTRWLLGEQEILNDQAVWDSGESGPFWVSLSHNEGLPPGEYTLELYIAERLAQRGTFTVVEANEPRPRTVNVIGTVVDRDNQRRNVADATVFLLNPGVTVDEWVDEDFPDSLIHAYGVTNRRGEFQMDAPVTPGETYALVVVQDDYEFIAEDGYEIPVDAADPYEIQLTMKRN